MGELLARLRAAARHAQRPQTIDSPVELGRFTVDLAARTVRRTEGGADDEPEGRRVHLTPNEWRMLEALLRRPGMLVTPTELLVAMRGDPEHTDRSYLRIYMQQLRRKLETNPSRPRHLLTEPSLGYRFLP
jgi:two-component system KDP operon response regulator KdpE